MYQQVNDSISGTVAAVRRLMDGAQIPFDPANTDYRQFKRDLQQGAPLKDLDGSLMSAAQIAAFLSSIP